MGQLLTLPSWKRLVDLNTQVGAALKANRKLQDSYVYPIAAFQEFLAIFGRRKSAKTRSSAQERRLPGATQRSPGVIIPVRVYSCCITSMLSIIYISYMASIDRSIYRVPGHAYIDQLGRRRLPTASY